MDPIDDYLNTKEAAAARRVEDDHSLVSQWQQQHASGQVDPALTHQLIERFQPTIQSAIGKYKSGLTSSGLDAEAKNLAIDAFRTFDPSKGAVFNTHLTNTLRRLQRRNLQNQTAYVPEAKAFYFGHADRARDELVDELGREPTAQEHEQRLNEIVPANKRLGPGELAPILALRKNSVLSSSFEGNMDTFAQNLHEQNVALARYDLNDKERKVYEHMFDQGITSTGAIAKSLGMSEPAVSRLKKRIEMKIKQPPKPPGMR